MLHAKAITRESGHLNINVKLCNLRTMVFGQWIFITRHRRSLHKPSSWPSLTKAVGQIPHQGEKRLKREPESQFFAKWCFLSPLLLRATAALLEPSRLTHATFGEVLCNIETRQLRQPASASECSFIAEGLRWRKVFPAIRERQA